MVHGQSVYFARSEGTGLHMINTRDAEMRRIAVRILATQAAVTLVLAALYLVFGSQAQSLSALAGGLIGLIANAYMTLTVTRSPTSAAGALGRLMVGQLVKIVIAVGGLFIVAKGGWANWPALLIGFFSTLVVYWFVPVLMTRARRPKD
jgi:F0F1-type ATP synthase assembly protein I